MIISIWSLVILALSATAEVIVGTIQPLIYYNMIIFDEFIFKVNTGTPDTKSLAVKDALNHENDVAKVDRSPAERERRFFVS